MHSCVKMKYKADFSPQYMLDPSSYAWDLLDSSLKSKLDTSTYLSISNPAPSTESSDLMDEDTEDIPIFSRPVPGLLTREQLLSEEVRLDRIKIRVREQEAVTGDLLTWDESSIDDVSSIKGIIAELVAAVGGEVAGSMVVYFG